MRLNFHGVIGEVDSLPGSSQVAVSHSVFLAPINRGKGLGRLAMRDRLTYLRDELGYDYVLCTVNSVNEAQIKLLEKAGWNKLDEYHSNKTGNTVCLYGRQL